MEERSNQDIALYKRENEDEQRFGKLLSLLIKDTKQPK